MTLNEANLSELNVLVMGLGLHGGGVETARYLARQGARVTCTDLRSEAELESSIASLANLGIRYVLGEHRMEDFEKADIIVKNPAVPSDSRWIAGRTNVETDISLFLQMSNSPILAVTGTKGKSTVVSALHHLLTAPCPGVRVGGNITVNPLSFIDELNPSEPVILELSSWQLADLHGRSLLKPEICCITNLMHDHQNHYKTIGDYEADKTVIFENADTNDITIFPDSPHGRNWHEKSGGTSYFIRGTPPTKPDYRGSWLDEKGQGWFDGGSGKVRIIPETLRIPGIPFRLNMLFAATMAYLRGCGPREILIASTNFSGVRYRMEMFLETGGIRCYDDTTATIPEATAAAIKAMDRPVILIAGGSDKKLDCAPISKAAAFTKRIILLQGSATKKWQPLIEATGAWIDGPYDDMDGAVDAAFEAAEPGDAIVLSPGAASFGMFHHEFHRGDAFKAACRRQRLSRI